MPSCRIRTSASARLTGSGGSQRVSSHFSPFSERHSSWLQPLPPAHSRSLIASSCGVDGSKRGRSGSSLWRCAFCSLPPLPGQAALPLLQHARQGDGAHQVLPRLLLRVPQDALRHPPEEVPQVQLRLWRQRLPPHLHHLRRRRRSRMGKRRDRGVAGTKGASRLEPRLRE